MRRFLLVLLSSSSLAGAASCLLGVLSPTHAAELKALPLDRKVCIESSHSRTNYVCTRVKDITKVKASPAIDLATNPQDSPYALEFSDEESDAAIALFGCDCPLCVNSLRKLRMMALGQM